MKAGGYSHIPTNHGRIPMYQKTKASRLGLRGFDIAPGIRTIASVTTYRGKRSRGLLPKLPKVVKDRATMPAFHVYCNGRTEPFPINDAADSDAAIAAAREAGFMPQRDIRNFRTVKLDKVGGSEDGPRIVPTIPSQRAPRQRPAAVKPAPEPKTPKE